MLIHRSIPTLVAGATLALAAAGAVSAQPGDWPAASDDAAAIAFTGDAMTAEPVATQGAGEPAPSPLSGTPANDDVTEGS